MPNDAATRAAETAADDAVRGAGIAIDAAKKAEQHAATIEQLVPDPHAEIVRELATHEAGALLNIGPKRNRWRDLQRFDQQLAELEQRREQISRDIGLKMADRNNEPLRLAAAIDAWIMGGQKGDRPTSQVPQLDQQIADLEAEYGAAGIAHDRLLAGRAAHVAANRVRMLKDVRQQVEDAASEYRTLVDQLEAKRQELLELRATEVWTAIYPSPTLSNEPNTAALVGAKKALQAPVLPGLESGLVANSVFALLRADAGFCESVATVEQAAIEQGVSVSRLRRSDAKWMNGKVDLVGPAFDAAWGGSDEEKEAAARAAEYAEVSRRRLWGEE